MEARTACRIAYLGTSDPSHRLSTVCGVLMSDIDEIEHLQGKLRQLRIQHKILAVLVDEVTRERDLALIRLQNLLAKVYRGEPHDG